VKLSWKSPNDQSTKPIGLRADDNDMTTQTRFRLVSTAGLYAGLLGLRASLVPREQAEVFDERDNPEVKAKFYGALLRTRFSVEIEQCAC
jgi:hypothetical protein